MKMNVVKWGLFACFPLTMTQLFGVVLIYLNEVKTKTKTNKQKTLYNIFLVTCKIPGMPHSNNWS